MDPSPRQTAPLSLSLKPIQIANSTNPNSAPKDILVWTIGSGIVTLVVEFLSSRDAKGCMVALMGVLGKMIIVLTVYLDRGGIVAKELRGWKVRRSRRLKKASKMGRTRKSEFYLAVLMRLGIGRTRVER